MVDWWHSRNLSGLAHIAVGIPGLVAAGRAFLNLAAAFAFGFGCRHSVLALNLSYPRLARLQAQRVEESERGFTLAAAGRSGDVGNDKGGPTGRALVFQVGVRPQRQRD